MKLRPYQTAAIDAARAAFKNGHRAICFSSPTGSGKGRILAEIAHHATGRVLMLAHRRELVAQLAGNLACNHGLVSASSTVAPRPDERVQVASIQTMQARGLWPQADIVIHDEVHHAPSDGMSALLARYSSSILIGATATPQRSDARGLGSLFTALIQVARISDLTRDGFLVPCHVIAPAAPLRPGTIAQRPVDAYLQHAAGQSAIVYAPTLDSARRFTAEFLELGVQAEMLDGTTDTDVRRDALEAFKAGTLPVLINCSVLTEGTDLPRCSAVIIARACGTLGLFLQIVGRALRPFPGKTKALVIDLRGVSHEHGHPSMDREWTLDGNGVRAAGDKGSDQAYCRVCAAPIMAGTGCDECGTEAASAQPLRVVHAPLKTYGHLKNPETAAKTLATLVQRYGHGRGRAIYRSMMSKANA